MPSHRKDAGKPAVTGLAPFRALVASVAVWQGVSFLALVALLWAVEVLDMPALIYGVPATPIDWVGTALATAGALTIGIIVVAHTSIQQRQELRGMIKICCSCKKLEATPGRWTPFEKYIEDRTDAEFTHGLCPACYEQLARKIKAVER